MLSAPAPELPEAQTEVDRRSALVLPGRSWIRSDAGGLATRNDAFLGRLGIPLLPGQDVLIRQYRERLGVSNGRPTESSSYRTWSERYAN